MICPDCKAVLFDHAKSCVCGWQITDRKKPPPIIGCHSAGCREPAMVRQKTDTGYVRLCLTHYDAFHARQAQTTQTPEEARQWLRENVAKPATPDAAPTDEPPAYGLPGEPGFLGDSS